MNNTKLYTELKKMEAGFARQETLPEAYAVLMNLIKDTEEDIQREASKSKQGCSTTIYKAACDILKTAQANERYCESLGKAHRTANTLDICDSYRLVRFNLDTAPVLEEHPAEFEYINADKIMPDLRDYTIKVDLPDIPQLKAFIKTEKARLKIQFPKCKIHPTWKIPCEDGEIWVDATYLLTMLECLPDAVALANPDVYKRQLTK